MSLIPCAENCVHQQDGYCCLAQSGKVSPVRTKNPGGCVYYKDLSVEAHFPSPERDKKIGEPQGRS